MPNGPAGPRSDRPVKARADQFRAAIDNPASPIRLFLLHGPDEAGAYDWARRLAKRMGSDSERVDIEGSTLRADPGRLADEAAALSLFGGARHIRVTGVGEDCLEAVALLLAAERAGNPVVAIGPALKATGKLLKLVHESPLAMALGCYPAEGANAERLAVAIAAEHGLRANGEAARRLVAASGGDRAIMTREIEKLALFLDASPDAPRALDERAIDAVGADLGEIETSRAVNAAMAGEAAELGSELARLSEAGVSAIPLLRALVRRLMLVAELRAEVDAGGNLDSAIKRNRIFFREEEVVRQAVRAWRAERISAAIDHVRRAERAMIESGGAGQIIADQALIAVARGAARAR